MQPTSFFLTKEVLCLKRLGLVLLAVCLLFTACSPTPLTETRLLLDTACTITLYDGDDALLNACFERITEDEARWSKTVENSDVAVLNRDGEAVVSEDTAALISQAITYSDLSSGAFDITAASLTALWQRAEEQGALPTPDEIADAVASVGYDRLTVNGATVTVPNGTQIDLGAIAKGAIADRAAAFLRENGCQCALIDLGGNIVAVGSKNGTPFSVGIADPRDPNALLTTVEVTDLAVVTSGSYERGFTVGGKRYSHILDPHTGYPVENDLASVTILCASATKADALTTACFVLGYEKAVALVENDPDIEAVFCLTDGTVIITDGVNTVE